MSVGFGTAVVVSPQTTGSLSFSMSGVTSKQPILVAVLGLGTTATAPSDSFSTHYTWTLLGHRYSPTFPTAWAALWLGTGGSGTSGTITVATTSGSSTGGVAVACTGASIASGTAAYDKRGQATANPGGGGSTIHTLSLTPSTAGEGAFYIVATHDAITASPSSPWTAALLTFSGVKQGGYALYPNAPNSALVPSWTQTGGHRWVVIGVVMRGATVPSPPTTVSAAPGNAQASVAFTVPTSNGGSAITGYKVTASTGQTATGGSSPIVVTGLTNGIPVTFKVTATNAVGTGIPSGASTAVTPGTAPTAPFLFGAGGGNTTVTLSWDAASTNGAPITGYNIYQGTTSGGESTTPVNSSPIAATSYVVTGLTNLTEYYFKVEAVNVWGSSSASNEISGTPAVPLTFVAAPTLSAVAGSDSHTGAPIITLTVTNNEAAQTGVAPIAYVTLLRSDGAYVINASPTFPLSITPGVGETATIIDRTAAYGVTVSYVAYISYGGGLSAPSAAQHVVMGQAPDTVALWRRMGWAADEDASGQLIAWLSGIGQMFQSIDNLSHDGFDDDGNPAPGWSQLLDINRCPTQYLPWLAQFLGVRLNTNLRDDQQRYAIANPQGFGRGTPAAIIAAVNQYLSPGYTATLIERDTSAYHLTLKIPTAGIAGLSTCESVYLTYTTCSALAAAYSTCAGLWKIPAEITAAVQNAIPAGLQAGITYD